MKIRKVIANSRRRAFEIHTRTKRFVFPYPAGSPIPTSEDPVADVWVDGELGNEGFTFRLASGAEGTIHIDHVLEYNEDPSYMADRLVYELTVEAQMRLQRSALSTRELIRRLGTSPAQFYRLLDTTNFGKSVRQLVSLLYLLGCDVELRVRSRSARRGEAPRVSKAS